MAHTMLPEKHNRGNLAEWVDSAAVKFLQQIVTLVLLPAAVWGMNVVVDKLSTIEKRLADYATTNATVELRIQSLERSRDALLAESQRQRDEIRDLRAAIFPPSLQGQQARR